MKMQELWLGKQVMDALVVPACKLSAGRLYKESTSERLTSLTEDAK